MARVLLTSCIYFLVFSIQPIQTAKIVGYPIFARSQYMGMKRIAEELVSRGHEVTLLVSSVQKIEPTRGIIHAVYKAPLSQEQLAEMVLANIQKDYKMIGPLNIKPVKPLPLDLQELIDSSGDDGAIIVSFGTNVGLFEKEKVDIMAEAFGRLKQKVIWKLQGYIPSSLSPNIKAVDWLPQNDLLAHKYLRVFVSHVGQNSLYETAYRGVPVVALPLFGDQFDNAALLEERGLGLKLDYKSLTADDLYNTIQRVMNEPRFRENAQRISRLLSDRPRSPAQEAADWIEYTVRHGGLAHLRPYSSQLAWYQYFLVDVVLFLVLIVFVVILLIKYTVRFVCWLCCRRNKKVKTQ